MYKRLLFVLSALVIQHITAQSRLEKNLDVFSEGLASSKQVPGITILVIKDGKTLYNKAFGYSDLETKSPMRPDNIFRIASQTKAITSIAVMMLLEEGKFLLDHPISKYISAFAGLKVLEKFNPADSSYTTVRAQKEITIRDLLRHTSGLAYAVISPNDRINAIYAKAGIKTGIGSKGDLKKQIELLGAQPVVHNPGDAFTYGLSFDVLGRLVEVLSGMSLDDFFRKRIFEPLGMNDTYFKVPQQKADRLVALSERKDGTFVKVNHLIYEGNKVNYPTEDEIYYSGGAGLSSTTKDYAKFLQMWLNGGTYNGKRLISKNTIELMLTNQLTDNIKHNEGFQFGLGVALVTEKNKYTTPLSIGSFYWGGVLNTQYWADPKRNLIGLVYTQVYGVYSTDIANQVKNIVYANLDNDNNQLK